MDGTRGGSSTSGPSPSGVSDPLRTPSLGVDSLPLCVSPLHSLVSPLCVSPVRNVARRGRDTVRPISVPVLVPHRPFWSRIPWLGPSATSSPSMITSPPRTPGRGGGTHNRDRGGTEEDQDQDPHIGRKEGREGKQDYYNRVLTHGPFQDSFRSCPGPYVTVDPPVDSIERTSVSRFTQGSWVKFLAKNL